MTRTTAKKKAAPKKRPKKAPRPKAKKRAAPKKTKAAPRKKKKAAIPRQVKTSARRAKKAPASDLGKAAKTVPAKIASDPPPAKEQARANIDPEVSETADLLQLFPKGKQAVINLVFGMTTAAMKMAARRGVSAALNQAIGSPPKKPSTRWQVTGAYVRDLRQVAGLTVRELSDAIQLPDQTLLQSVEKGTAILSFDLILRLAAFIARHDPVPFVVRMIREYHPETWKVLEKWGVGKIPLQLEREREFINILRGSDISRKLSEEGFGRVIAFTRNAFELALAYAAEAEGLKLPPEASDSKNQSEKQGP